MDEKPAQRANFEILRNLAQRQYDAALVNLVSDFGPEAARTAVERSGGSGQALLRPIADEQADDTPSRARGAFVFDRDERNAGLHAVPCARRVPRGVPRRTESAVFVGARRQRTPRSVHGESDRYARW